MRLYLLLSLPRRRIFCRNSTVSDRFNWWKRKEGKFYSQLELDSRKKAGSSFSGTFRRTKFGKGIWGGGRDGSWRIQDSRIKGILSPRYSVFGNRWSPRNFLLGIPGTTAAIRPGSRGQHGLPRICKRYRSDRYRPFEISNLLDRVETNRLLIIVSWEERDK